jgi:CRISPR-associated protein Cas1
MGAIADRAFAVDALRAAWEEVLENDRADGVESRGVHKFSENTETKLTSLSQALIRQEFTPGCLKPVRIQSGTKTRQLHVPCVRDRITARAILGVVTPIIDPELGHSAYAYRPGLGVSDAVQAVALLREEGLTAVLRTDIKDCFTSLPKHVAMTRFTALIADEAVNAVVTMFIERSYRSDSGAIQSLEGVPQGCPLSPMLANLVLRDLDAVLVAEGFPVVRYGDDVLVATKTQEEAHEASRIINAEAGRLGMEDQHGQDGGHQLRGGLHFSGRGLRPALPALAERGSQ